MGHSTTAAPLSRGACTGTVWSEVLKVTLEAFTSKRPVHFWGMTLLVLWEAMKTLSHSSCGQLSSWCLGAEGKISQDGHLDLKLRISTLNDENSQMSEWARKTSEPSVSAPGDVGFTFLTLLTDLVVSILKVKPSWKLIVPSCFFFLLLKWTDSYILQRCSYLLQEEKDWKDLVQ